MEKIYGEKDIILPKVLDIPEIDDKRLLDLYKKLKPIVTLEEIKYFLRKYTLKELKVRSFTWFSYEDRIGTVDPSKLEPVEDFLCLHTWPVHHGSFQPTIYEVLAQSPEKTIEEANTFEIIECPETRGDIFRYQPLVYRALHL